MLVLFTLFKTKCHFIFPLGKNKSSPKGVHNEIFLYGFRYSLLARIPDPQHDDDLHSGGGFV
jgi:hypothetical protein